MGDINGAIAAKRSCSFVRQSAGRPPHLPAPGMAWKTLEGWSRLGLRRARSNALLRSSYTQPKPSTATRCGPHRRGPWILATDGGVGIPTSAGIGILLSSLRSSEIIEKVSTNCGTRPCSRTTKSRALLPAMERLSVHRIQHRQKPCLWLQTVSLF
ncbi:RNaseH [Trypanosoma cruzi]|nr:RNaseH [Trypanosoma cruzi]